jgi:signal peptidase I
MRIGPNIYASMWPTIVENDVVHVEDLPLGSPISRFDIVMFLPPAVDSVHIGLGEKERFVKRVIGLPGERIEIVEGVGVMVDGGVLREQLHVANKAEYSLKILGDIGGMMAQDRDDVRPYFGTASESEPIVVPDGNYFVLGDNRNFSVDSHVFGFVTRESIEGRLEAITERKLVSKRISWRCSFCQTSESDVEFLMHGLGGFICTNCVHKLRTSHIHTTAKPARCLLCMNWRESRACKSCLQLAAETCGAAR